MKRNFICSTALLGCFLVTLLIGCEEEEEPLSELIVGSWCATDPDMTGTILVPLANGEIMSGKMDWTLSFYRDGRFDNVFEVSVSLAGESVGNLKSITEGTYQVFDSSLVFRAQDSYMQVTPPDFREIAESGFSEMLEGMESMFTDTFTASVEERILTLGGEIWQRI